MRTKTDNPTIIFAGVEAGAKMFVVLTGLASCAAAVIAANHRKTAIRVIIGFKHEENGETGLVGAMPGAAWGKCCYHERGICVVSCR